MRSIESLIKQIIPEQYHHILQRCKQQLVCLILYGRKHVCPICGGHFRKFLPFGYSPRPNAQCPRCGLVERHRLLWLYLKNSTDFFTAKLKILDIAPSDYLQRKFKTMKNLDYISIDLESSIAMLRMDVTDLQFPDNWFDCIICYHVLEHVYDDLKAMREIFRVLKPHGWAIIQVPVSGEKTVDGPDITSPEERARLFGQPDHVRAYGLDYKERLESAGFTVTLYDYVKQLDAGEVGRYGLNENESIYVCSKA